MTSLAFDAFFTTATKTAANPGYPPYDYQRQLAGGDGGRPCESQLISIPTGLGKTAAVVLAWIWNRVARPDAANRETWPRRLVICLPLRPLVEQTHDEGAKWLRALAAAYPENAGLRWLARDHHSPVILMGGEDSGGWDKAHTPIAKAPDGAWKHHGPLRLAYWETLLRAADERASAKNDRTLLP